MAQRQRHARAIAQTQPSNYKLIFAFLVAGVWANAVFAFVLIQETRECQILAAGAQYPLAVDLTAVEAQDTFVFRNRKKPEAPRTQPYDEQSAPEFEYPQPIDGLPQVTPEAPQSEEGTETGNEITDILNSLKALFAGEGGFQDILTLVIAGFALFGGGKFAASDGLFKAILAIFSKRSNFTELLNERLKASGAPVSASRPRKRAAKK